MALIILGVDPGTRHTGYGVVAVEGSKERALDWGTVSPGDAMSHPLRLDTIYQGLIEVLDRHKPDECAVEMPVFGKNAQSMLKLGRAQAAAMLAAMHREVAVTQYTPKEIKKSVTGNGNASKDQVGFMVRQLLGIPEVQRHDAADALATALCHAHRLRQGPVGKHKDWKSFIEANPGRIV
ncbi:MAG: crossover junction endodeoxyribonuclease RuvC [Rhodothermales bacterium]|nr:crossover junction endodeoxyribonuclease RuvC [Rhodothermales bacterium]